MTDEDYQNIASALGELAYKTPKGAWQDELYKLRDKIDKVQR